MTAIAPLVERARRMVLGSQRVQINTLTSTITPTDLSLTLALEVSNVTPGCYLDCELETMYVTALDGAVATVLRGVDGSTAVAHTAGTVLRVNPIVSGFDIYSAMLEELADLSSPSNGLYRVSEVDLAPIANANLYDITGMSDVMEIIRARATDTTGQWFRVEARLESGMATADFLSGNAVRLDFYCRRVRLWVKRPFGALDPANVEASGLAATALDLLPIGAAYRFFIPREGQRNLIERQGDTRRAEEVPTGAQRQALTPLAALRRVRIEAEKSRLDAQWPVERGRAHAADRGRL